MRAVANVANRVGREVRSVRGSPEERESQENCRHDVLWICGVLLALHVVLLGYSAAAHSPTIDEVAHMAAGVSHWELGRFDLYRVNPPLVRLLATLPVAVVGYVADWTGYSTGPGERPEFYLGDNSSTSTGAACFICSRGHAGPAFR